MSENRRVGRIVETETQTPPEFLTSNKAAVEEAWNRLSGYARTMHSKWIDVIDNYAPITDVMNLEDFQIDVGMLVGKQILDSQEKLPNRCALCFDLAKTTIPIWAERDQSNAQGLVDSLQSDS